MGRKIIEFRFVLSLVFMLGIIAYASFSFTIEDKRKENARSDLLIIKSLIDVDEFKELSYSNHPIDNKYYELLTAFKAKYDFVYTVKRDSEGFVYLISGFFEDEFSDTSIPQKVDEDKDYVHIFEKLNDYTFYHTITNDQYGHLMSTHVKLSDNLILALDIPAKSFDILYIVIGLLLSYLIIDSLILRRAIKKKKGGGGK